MPNVRIIRPDFNTKQLIRNAKAVFTLTSTVGLEACIMGKPVVVLGDAPYAWYKSCYRLNGYRDIKPAIQWVEAFHAPSSCDIKAFIGSNFVHASQAAFDFRVLFKNDTKLDEFCTCFIESVLA